VGDGPVKKGKQTKNSKKSKSKRVKKKKVSDVDGFTIPWLMHVLFPGS